MRTDRSFRPSFPIATLWATLAAGLIAAAPLALAAPNSAGATSADHQNNTAAESSNAHHRVQTVIVRAQRMVRHQIVGRDYAGIPIEQLELSREVGYRDLNLKTTKGADELISRINNTARQACHQLSGLYPLAMWTTSNQMCVNQAEKMAMAQLPVSVAQLKSERSGTPE
jgi:UrcA family protein